MEKFKLLIFNKKPLLLFAWCLLFIGSCDSIDFEIIPFSSPRTVSPIKENESLDNNQDNKIIDEALMPYCDSFMNRYNSIKEKEAFLFFSDPHLMARDNSFGEYHQLYFNSSFESMRFIYNALPFEFCLCGGDWLNNKDFQETAMWKLLYADSKMQAWFPPYYKMLGNHDTNYQGVVSESDDSRGDLPYDFIDSVYFKKTGGSYYTIKGKHTLFVILDTGIDWETDIKDYRRQQIDWLSRLLYANKEQHVVIGMHMFFYGKVENNTPFPMSREIMRLCSAFNHRESYTFETSSYDYSMAQGKVHFIICGHNHVDFEYHEGDIPCVGITKFISNNQPTYDLCLIDYDLGYLYMIRVGEGKNRQVAFSL